MVGNKGNGGQLPVITNTTGALAGNGVILAQDNTLKHIHIKDTENSAIIGSFLIQDFGGAQTMHGIQVTGANQSGAIAPALGFAWPSILLVPIVDSDINIKNSDIGAANVSSVFIFHLSGHGNVTISNTTVRDQDQLTEDFEFSPGISVYASGDASLDVAILDTSVRNIGSAFASNSDGLLLLNGGSGAMTVVVDGYHYSNPDGGGFFGTSTGIEMGVWDAANGTSFTGVVSNSVIESPFFAGIQILDDESLGNNTVSVDVIDNQVSGTLFGVQGFIDESPNSKMFLNITGNTIGTYDPFGENYSRGMELGVFLAPVDAFEVLLERNTILNTDGVGLSFLGIDTTIENMHIDAGSGGLGSIGENRIIGSVVYDISSVGVPVWAGNNWWGSASGPSSVGEFDGGTVDVEPFLTEDPN